MDPTNLTGHFIIAMPSLLDENFDRTVTYICEHDENGTFGIVINRETDVILQEVLAQMNISLGDNPPQKQSIFLGGPVQQERGFILHKPMGNWGSSLKVNDDITIPLTFMHFTHSEFCTRGHPLNL